TGPRRVLGFALALAGAALHGCASGEPEGDAGAQAASVPEPDVVLQADQTHARWSATIPPVARVQSGAVVDAFTAEASDGQLSLESTAADAASLDFDPIHPLTGPVYVEGAQPGDVLAVTLLDM